MKVDDCQSDLRSCSPGTIEGVPVVLPPVLLQGSTALVTTSEVIVLNTQPIALPTVLVLFSVALVAGIVVALVVFFFVFRRCVEFSTLSLTACHCH